MKTRSADKPTKLMENAVEYPYVYTLSAGLSATIMAYSEKVSTPHPNVKWNASDTNPATNSYSSISLHKDSTRTITVADFGSSGDSRLLTLVTTIGVAI